jgi:hypothetical protein
MASATHRRARRRADERVRTGQTGAPIRSRFAGDQLSTHSVMSPDLWRSVVLAKDSLPWREVCGRFDRDAGASSPCQLDRTHSGSDRWLRKSSTKRRISQPSSSPLPLRYTAKI